MIILLFFFPFILFNGFVEKEVFAQNLPVIPRGELTATEAMRIRDELEITKQDIEQKIVKLQEAKKSYDLARLDVDSRLKKIEEEKRLLDETLQKEKKLKEDRVKEAVEFVSKMEPRKVAPVMDTMDRDLVIALLSRLPARQVTKLLENSSPAKATQFLEYYTRIRSGREFEMLRELGLCAPAKEKNEEKGKSPP
ncbi:MotE family protein [Silvanigrella sp.]|uniref:MotE family protein n=1 Tax=Silvanigrella sp. TaxID=2024976 RepID=UPI0037CBE64A